MIALAANAIFAERSSLSQITADLVNAETGRLSIQIVGQVVELIMVTIFMPRAFLVIDEKVPSRLVRFAQFTGILARHFQK
jgi:hypothetical protein